MPRCPTCAHAIPRSLVLGASAPRFWWRRDDTPFRLRCPSCGDTVGIERRTGRIFFLLCLCPLPLLAWLAHVAGFVAAPWVVLLPLAWLILFPVVWLDRVRLVPIGPQRRS